MSPDRGEIVRARLDTRSDALPMDAELWTALDDLLETKRWYGQRDQALGQAFAAAIDAAVDRMLVRRFAYADYFRESIALTALLALQAARHGRSMEEESRTILRTAIESSQAEVQVESLGSCIQAHFAELGGMELDMPERSSSPAAAECEPR
ncbi:hypothetical protein SynWH8101_1259 [Synechococcus sp. WH 8101]|uniref:FitA-like ribbon-helix-helix domain-containing protein n=1 Tax=Synechococcus sp. WH 8101 TaxID=59932 RepID=UPI0010245632|nr:hypothetical protein [Synechococcus sp. WH 8101]QBE68845.1 hypothetical protein SynWH8101_1259 [Synechococcus sp. WH 8101]QNI45071.1 hypothetical protein SynRCC2555_01288 [Synechococcus sp. WH 8101]